MFGENEGKKKKKSPSQAFLTRVPSPDLPDPIPPPTDSAGDVIFDVKKKKRWG